MKIHDLKDAFLVEMQDLLGAEQQVQKSLKKMAQAATHSDLKKVFEQHMQQTEGQIKRLEDAFELMGEKAKGKECAGMAGILDEGEEMVKQADESEVRDAMLIAAAQKVEHYEIAGYGTACTWAEVLGMDDVAKLLKETLKQEKESDEKLTKLAQQVNRQAQPTG